MPGERYPARNNRGVPPDRLGEWVDGEELAAQGGGQVAGGLDITPTRSPGQFRPPFPPASFPVASPTRLPGFPATPPRLPGSPWSPLSLPGSPWSPPRPGSPWSPPGLLGSPWTPPRLPGFRSSPPRLQGLIRSPGLGTPTPRLHGNCNRMQCMVIKGQRGVEVTKQFLSRVKGVHLWTD